MKRVTTTQQERYSKASIHWLETVAQREGIKILHAENSYGETRIENYKVDGFCEEINTAFEYDGCYHHGHGCSDKTNDPVKWAKTMERKEHLRQLGFNVRSITSCEWLRDPESNNDFAEPQACTEVSVKGIEERVRNDEVFGLIQYSGHFPDELKEKYADFGPIFKNVPVDLTDIGDHMQTFCIATGRTKGVDRALIGSFKADKHIVLTPLLKLYLEMGFILTDVQFLMEFRRKSVFSWFRDEVSDDRRRADLSPEFAVRGLTSKTKGNCGYGRTIMDKTKHINTAFTFKNNVSIHINSPMFKHLEQLSEGVFEVDKKKEESCVGLAGSNRLRCLLVRKGVYNSFLAVSSQPSKTKPLRIDSDGH